jgi:outer membrane protein TolC
MRRTLPQLAGAEAQLQQPSEQYRSVVLTAFQRVEDALLLLNNLGQESAAAPAPAAVTDATHTLDMSMAGDYRATGGMNEMCQRPAPPRP